jgi:hypothetical protein
MSDSAFPHDPKSVDFLWLIGRIVIAWSRLERTIDFALMSGRTLIPGHFKKDPPFALDRKTKAFRALCKQVPELADSSSLVERCISEFLRLAEDRHTIVHGFFHGISGEHEPQIYFRRGSPLSGEAGKRLIKTREELRDFFGKSRSWATNLRRSSLP